MKVLTMMTLMMCFFSMYSFSQNKLVGKKFTTTFETGIGEKVQMVFEVDSANIEKIKKTEMFKSRFGSLGSGGVEIFLASITSNANFYARNGLKNKTSYTPISGSSYIYSNEGKVTVVFPLKGQNGYGNFVLLQSFYIIEWKEGKEDKFYFLSDN